MVDLKVFLKIINHLTYKLNEKDLVAAGKWKSMRKRRNTSFIKG